MIEYSSSANYLDILAIRSLIEENGYVVVYPDKKYLKINNPKTRITRNRHGVYILWIGERK